MNRSVYSKGIQPLFAVLILLGVHGTFADEITEAVAEVVVEQAWVEGLDLYVTYTTRNASGELERRAVHGLFEEAIAHLVSRKDVPVIRLQPTDPAVEPTPGTDVAMARLLSLEDWDRCWENALDHIAPPEAMRGLKGRLAGFKVVAYRESDGTPQLILADEKPPWIDVDGPLSFADIAEAITRAVETCIGEQNPGMKERFLLFRTNRIEGGLLPFLALDRVHRVPVLFTFEWTDEQRAPAKSSGGLIRKTLSGAGLVVSSLYHTIIRPVTSLYMLFDALVDGTVDLTYPLRRGRMPSGEPPPLEQRDCMDTAAWERLLSNKMGIAESRGTISFQVGGPAFFLEVMKSMFEAERDIAIRTYIFDTDDYASSVADILKTRSEEIETRILFDTLGSSMAADAMPEHMPESHEAPPSIKKYLSEDSAVQVRLRPNPWFMGDHSKTWIIDGKTVYLGGINIGREYRTEWHDMMAKVEGPVVDVILKEFHKAWNYSGAWGDLGLLFSKASGKKQNQDHPGYPVRILWTKPGSSQILKAQKAAMRNARQRIIVENAYLSSTELINELIRARHRGVDVMVILPEQGNHGVMNANNRVVANHLLENGVKVYLYPGMSHVKAALYDGWACLGSANFDRLSLRFNMELNIATSHPEAVNELLEELFLPDIEASRLLEQPLKVRSMDILSRRLAAALL